MKYPIFLIAAMLASAAVTVGTIGIPQQVFAEDDGDESTTELENKNKIDCTSSGFKYGQDCGAVSQTAFVEQAKSTNNQIYKTISIPFFILV